jgi:HEAT repeat protein
MRPNRFHCPLPSWVLGLGLSLVLAIGCGPGGDSGDPGEWTEVHERLQTIGDHGITAEDDVPFTLERLENGSASERVVAAWALGMIRHAGAEPKLRDALDDKNANVRSNVLGALLKLGPADGVDLLARGLADKDPFVQQSTLSQMSDPTPEALIEPISALLVESEDELVRIGAADTLGEARGDGVAEALARGAADAAKDVRVHVAFALGKIESRTAIPVLASLLEDPSWEVRANAVQALGKYEEPDALEAVRGMLDDPNESVRAVAASIVGG